MAQRHAGAVEHHPEVRRGDAQRFANNGSGHVVHFPHEEDGGDALGELAEAGVERGEEFSAVQGLFAAGVPLARCAGVVVPEVVGIEFFGGLVTEEDEVGEGGLAAKLAEVVADFVLQDAEQPGADGRAPAESTLTRKNHTL